MNHAGPDSDNREFRKVCVAFDGGCKNNPNGEAAGGAVITDPDGRLLRHIGRAIGIGSNNVAEWTGLLIGLEAARELGATHVDVVGDSELVVRQFIGRYRINNDRLKELSLQVAAVSRTFVEVHIRHTGRENNGAADSICTAVLNGRYQSDAQTLDAAIGKSVSTIGSASAQPVSREVCVSFTCRATMAEAAVREARERGLSDAALYDEFAQQVERRLTMAGQLGKVTIVPKRIRG